MYRGGGKDGNEWMLEWVEVVVKRWLWNRIVVKNNSYKISFI